MPPSPSPATPSGRRRRNAGEALGLGLAATVTLLYALLLTSDAGAPRAVAGWFRVFELKTLDARMALRGGGTPSGQVVIVEIDEKSIAALGRFPWDRRIHARLIDSLHAMGARAIGLDALFSEPASPEEDEELARAMRRAGNVYLAAHVIPVQEPGRSPSGLETGSEPAAVAFPDFSFQLFLNPPPPAPAAPASAGSGASTGGRARRTRLAPPVAVLASAAAGIGLGELGDPDADHVFRWLQLAHWVDEPGRYYPPFALVVAMGARGGQIGKDAVLDFGRGVQTRQLGWIPTDPSGHLLVDFLGGPRTFEYISYVDVLNGAVDPDRIRGRVVLVGATAKGLSDFQSTPLAVLPGVEIHATAVDNLLTGRHVKLPGWERLPVMLLLTVLVALTLARLDARRGVFAAFVILAGYGVVASVAFVGAGRWLHLSYPLAGALAVGSVQLGYGYLTQERQKLIVRRTFERYVPPEVVKELLQDPERVRLGGERRTITVLFADIRGFTSMSERIPAEDVVRFLNAYFAVMTPVIYRHGGIVDKFEGDAIMALFGAPVAHPDHAIRAVRAALAMQDALAAVQAYWPAAHVSRLRIGVGIATGEAVVGNIGSPDRLNYTAVGDTVNLAARLQDLNKELGTEILISEATYAEVRDAVEAVPIPGVQIRGRSGTVTVYSVAGAAAQLPSPGRPYTPPLPEAASQPGTAP